MTDRTTGLNVRILQFFAPLLILVGVSGFISPSEGGMTSVAPAYNLFHIVFGLLGLIPAAARSKRGAALFNIVFGFIDLYQAAASAAGFFPRDLFLWTPVDDILHLVIGTMLILAGARGVRGERLRADA